MSKTLNSFRATMELRGIRHQAAQYLLAELGSVLLFFFFSFLYNYNWPRTFTFGLLCFHPDVKGRGEVKKKNSGMNWKQRHDSAGGTRQSAKREEEEEEEEEEGERDGEGKRQWTRKGIFEKTGSGRDGGGGGGGGRGRQEGAREGGKWRGRKKRNGERAAKLCPCGRVSEVACVWWNDMSAPHLLRFAAQLGCHDDQHILARLRALCIPVSRSRSPFASLPPSIQTLTYINLVFVWSQNRIEVSLKNAISGVISRSLFFPFYPPAHAHTSKCLLARCQRFPSAGKIKAWRISGRIQEVGRWKEPA